MSLARRTAYLIKHYTLQELQGAVMEQLPKYRAGKAYDNQSMSKKDCVSILKHKEREEFLVLYLNNQHELIESRIEFQGTIASAEVHPREIAKRCLENNAAAIIISHNHPSGITEPSQSDLNITSTIINAMQLLEIRVLDHIIVAGNHAYSFAEQGILPGRFS